MSKKTASFLWGVTNIAYQTEGGNATSNWAQWGRRGLVPSAGQANGYWQRFAEDHALAQGMGVNAFRLSLEWSRIEPEEGQFDEAALAHYQTILTDLRSRNMQTVVGLWHWSVPAWFEERYGMHHAAAPQLFHRYVQKVLAILGDHIDIIIVLNEPMVFVGMGYLRGEHPPFLRSPWKAWRVLQNFVAMQKAVYTVVKKDHPQMIVGSAHLWNDYYASSGEGLPEKEPHRSRSRITSGMTVGVRGLFEKTAVRVSDWFRVHYLLKRLQQHQDFIGINYYRSSGVCFRFQKGGMCGFHSTDDPHDSDGWKAFPPGLYRVLMHAYRRYKQPVMILENGKPTNCIIEDDERCDFLTQSVAQMQRAMAEGVDVRGYFHYALCDAYEWTGGYDYFFGLVQVDRSTLERTKRRSFGVYKEIIEGL